MDLVEVPLAEIKPYWRNPRHNQGAIAAVKKSIEDYGYNQPLVLDENRVIIVGHTRYKVLLHLGYTAVDCIIATHLSEEEAKEYRIADNASGEQSEWDWNALIPEVRSFRDPDALNTYFPKTDWDQLLGNGIRKQADQSAIDRRGQQMASQFTDRNAKELADYLNLTCPECGEDFAVKKDDFMKRLEKGPTDD
jgi:hypothetical protein